MTQMETEVLIIGGGVLGAAVARELSRYSVDVILVEKEADLGWGSTKTNMCIVCQGGDTLRQMEPNVTREAIAALFDPNIAIVDPVRLTIALIENAGQNGVKVMRETEVLNISQKGNQFEVETNRGSIKCRFIVNAAGTSVEKIARLVNSDDFVLYPIRGYVGILDKNSGGLIKHEIHMRPDAPGQIK